MALNQQIQYLSAYSKSGSDSQTPTEFQQEQIPKNITGLYKKYRPEIKYRESEAKKIEVEKALVQVESNLISQSKNYALKKRLLLPIWLVEGILLVLGTKEPWFESIASSRIGKVFACPSSINVKSLIPFFLVWNELITKIFQTQSNEKVIKLQINKFISGTKKDIQEISKEIETIFSSPLKIVEVKQAKKAKSYTMSKKGSLNFIRHAELENDVDGVWLTLNLTNSFRDICHPPELKSSVLFEVSNIVSISPVVIQSMGSRASLKKVLNYLFLEFSKQQSYELNSNWNSFRIDSKKITHFHKDFLSTAPAFYDHGVLGWNNCAPNMKISEIKRMNQSPSHTHEIICAWQLSEQVKEAYEIEQKISEKIRQDQTNEPYQSRPSLFPIPPEDQLQKVREERKIKRFQKEKEMVDKSSLIEKKLSHFESPPKKTPKKIITQTLFDDGLLSKKVTHPIQTKSQYPKESHETFQPIVQSDMADNEFLVLVSEFYESLKPMQKKAFEKDRKGMSREQFKAYMSSILHRKKSHPL